MTMRRNWWGLLWGFTTKLKEASSRPQQQMCCIVSCIFFWLFFICLFVGWLVFCIFCYCLFAYFSCHRWGLWWGFITIAANFQSPSTADDSSSSRILSVTTFRVKVNFPKKILNLDEHNAACIFICVQLQVSFWGCLSKAPMAESAIEVF